MPNTDAFALANSGLNPFLFAEVGYELNGSPLTLLSVLGRLGKDPWAEAKRWSALPKATLIDAIVSSITQMPLQPQAMRDAPQTAARLILLLPKADAGPIVSGGASLSNLIPRSITVVLLVCAVTLGLAINSFWVHPPPNPPDHPVSVEFGKK